MSARKAASWVLRQAASFAPPAGGELVAVCVLVAVLVLVAVCVGVAVGRVVPPMERDCAALDVLASALFVPGDQPICAKAAPNSTSATTALRTIHFEKFDIYPRPLYRPVLGTRRCRVDNCGSSLAVAHKQSNKEMVPTRCMTAHARCVGRRSRL